MAAVQAAPIPAHELVFTPKELPRLRANQGEYVDKDSVSWMQPTPSAPLEEIRKRYENDGYVWLKHVIPREHVYDMRELYFTEVAATGILEKGTSPREGIFNSSLDPLDHQGLGGDPRNSSKKILDAVHSHSGYREFLEHPDLRRMVRELTGWEKEVLLNRALLRHNVPKSLSTGIHYDQLFLRAGEPVLVTAWIPIGDCSANGGGLDIEADYDRRALNFTPKERIDAFNVQMGEGGHVSHDASDFLRREGKGHTCLVGDYEAGDVVFHKPYMIQGATKNEDPSGRIRLATDLRFYEDGAPLDQRWMKTFYHGDGL